MQIKKLPEPKKSVREAKDYLLKFTNYRPNQKLKTTYLLMKKVQTNTTLSLYIL